MNFEPMNFYEFLETSKNERLLNEFYSISNINFDFDKVSVFLKEHVPDLELFLKIEKLSLPKSVPDFCKFCFYLMDLFNQNDSVTFQNISVEKVKNNPELHDYILEQIEKHNYKLDKDNHFIQPGFIVVDFETFKNNVDDYAFNWLKQNVFDDFFLIDYSKFFSECSL